MNTFIKILIILFACFCSLFFLKMSSTLPNEKANGFQRKWFDGNLEATNETTFNISLKSICGSSNSTLYLAGQYPNAILVLNKDLTIRDTILINLDIPADKIVPYKLIVDSPKLYLHVNNLKEIILGDFPNKPLSRTKIKTEIFTKSLQISDSIAILRSIDPSLKKQSFKKVNCLTGEIIMENELIKNQEDAGISSDGMLVYSKKMSRIIYVQYLSNKFYCLDTNLRPIYEGKTIDTNTTVATGAKFQIDKQVKKGKIMPSKARVTVNKDCFASDSHLFIISALRADNEKIASFNQNSAIDVYSLEDGTYVGSFYIPKINDKPFQSVKIQNDRLFVLYDKKIVAFNLNIIRHHEN